MVGNSACPWLPGNGREQRFPHAFGFDGAVQCDGSIVDVDTQAVDIYLRTLDCGPNTASKLAIDGSPDLSFLKPVQEIPQRW